METHQLRYFLAVAQSGRFTAAARACNVSQPSLSVQVAKLEEELGGALFERSRRGARLTARGELFLPRAKAVLGEMEAAHREVESLAGLSTGKVTLGCLPTTGAHVLPRVLAAFRRAHPKVQVLLREESSPGLARCLEQGEVDLAILDEAGLRSGMEHVPLLSEDLLAALPPRHPLAGKGRVALRQLAGDPFILMKPDHGFRTITDSLMRKAGIEPRVVFESGEIETVQALVGAGLGVSIVPQMVRRASGLSYAELAQSGASRSLILAWRRRAALSPAAEAMRRTVRETLTGGDA
jgi:DNA-binding transcriptional LysR family regulator